MLVNKGTILLVGSVIFLLSLVVVMIFFIRLRRLAWNHRLEDKERRDAVKQSVLMLAYGTGVCVVVSLSFIHYALFPQTMISGQVFVVEGGIACLQVGCFFLMHWAIFDAWWKWDHTLSTEKREKMFQAKHVSLRRAIGFALAGCILVGYALVGYKEKILEMVYPLKFAFGLVAFALSIILFFAWRKHGGTKENRSLSVPGRSVALSQNLPIATLAVGFLLVGILFMILAFME
jgi:hypothetical protein